jgi:hypothetical protein
MLRAIRGDQRLLKAMLDDERVFQRLLPIDDEDALMAVSPLLLFTVLLRRARQDMAAEDYTWERRHMQNVVIFDTRRVVELIQQDENLEYLAQLLASFTRVESVTVRVRVRDRLWRKYRTSSLDVEGLIARCQTLGPDARFDCYRRVADACLFLCGMFPEYIERRFRYPLSKQIRPQMRSRVVRSREDFEAQGRAFYALAAEQVQAKQAGLDEVLSKLSEGFVLAEKPLAHLAERYLGWSRHELFHI